jgi:glyoxylate reductase
MAGKKKPLVVITRKLPDPVETRMRELFDARLNIDDKPMSREALAAAMQEADVLVPTITDRIDGELIAGAGEKLRLIANFGNGVDHIDVATAGKKGIAVTNTPNVLTEDTADMTMGLILTVPRRLIEGASLLVDNGKWAGWSPTWMLGRRIWGKRLGIVGMGRIGTAVARRAKAFGLSIHYHNRKRVIPAVEDELEATSAYIVNTARGDIIDEDALIKLIQDGKIAGAGLDVFEHEPAINPKLLKLAAKGKVVLLPHMGSATIEGRIDMGEKVIINIKTWVDGHKPPDRVLPSML